MKHYILINNKDEIANTTSHQKHLRYLDNGFKLIGTVTGWNVSFCWEKEYDKKASNLV